MIKLLLKNLLKKSGYSIVSLKYLLKQYINGSDLIQLDFDHVLSKYLTLNKTDYNSFTFIQIGAFDGIQCDPLYKFLKKFNWKGIMLEPQWDPFNKLKKRYEDRPEINIQNVAISDTIGKSILYILEGEILPEWAKGMASFSRNNILKHKYIFPNISDCIKETEIATITFEKLLSEQKVTDLDLLQVDTEGYDAEIISMFPFDNLKPAIIHFESKHIPKKRLEKLLDDLIGYGYKIARDREEDMIAILDK